MDTDDTLSIALVVAAIRGGIAFPMYKELAEFLGCYNYVKPADRTMSCSMLAYLCENIQSMTDTGMRASSIFQAWQVGVMIETVLTERQQDRCVEWLININKEI